MIGSKTLYFDNLTSTNSHAIHLLSAEKLSEGTIIQAGFQSAGRGQPGNAWESTKDKNLLMSIILYPEEINPDNQFLVSMSVSLGICDYLDQVLTGVSVKWPNDIYVNDDKIAGTLIESSTMGNKVVYMVAGIGLNVNQEIFRSNAPNPVSMKMLTGKEYPLDDVLAGLCRSIDKWYGILKDGNLRKILKEYNSRLYRLNKWSSYRDNKGGFTGRIKSSGVDGRITMEKKDAGRMQYYFKEVEFII